MTATGSKSLQHERTFSEIKRLSTSGLDGPELLRRTAERLRKSVPFAAYCASTTDPGSGLITHGLANGFGQDDSQTANVFLDRIYFEEGLPQISSMLRERRTVQLLSETTSGKLDSSMRYRELLEPNGFGYELGGAFTDGNLWAAWNSCAKTETRTLASER